MSLNAYQIPEAVPGALDLYNWFGYWPSFHDAEILDITLSRKGLSAVRVHIFHRTNRVDENRFYILEKHVVVTFLLKGITDCNLEGFSHQNVVSCIQLNIAADGYVLRLGPCFGVAGSISATDVRIQLVPGKPKAE